MADGTASIEESNEMNNEILIIIESEGRDKGNGDDSIDRGPAIVIASIGLIAISIAALMGMKVVMPKLALSGILIILGLHIGNYIDQNLTPQTILKPLKSLEGLNNTTLLLDIIFLSFSENVAAAIPIIRALSPDKTKSANTIWKTSIKNSSNFNPSPGFLLYL